MEPALEFSKFVLFFALVGFVLHHRGKSDRVLEKVTTALREAGTKHETMSPAGPPSASHAVLETATRDEAIEEVRRLRRKSFLNTQAVIVLLALAYMSTLEWGTPLFNVGVALLALLYGLYYMGALLGCDDLSPLTGTLGLMAGLALLVEATAIFLVLLLGDSRTSLPWYVFLGGLIIIVSMAASHGLLRFTGSMFVSRFVPLFAEPGAGTSQDMAPPSLFERALVALFYVAVSLLLMAPTIHAV